LLALALLANLASAGSRYFYCPFMDAVVSEHCCASRSVEQVRTLQQPDCCEVRTLDGVPAALASTYPSDLPIAPLVAVVGPVAGRAVIALSPAFRRMARSGLSPPPARRSAQQIVLRT
jgi:hypothetical protein